MGCLSSKEMEDDPHAIPYRMRYTYLPDSIRFWWKCEELLSQAEDLRSGLEDNKDDMLDLADCDKLINGTLLDAIQGWLWCLSAVKGGAIIECGLNLTTSPPYFYINQWEYNWDLAKFNRCFEDYAKTCFEGPDTIESLIGDAKEILVRAEELAANFKEQAESSNLNLIEIAQAIGHTVQNVVTLKDGIQRMERLKGILQDAMKDLNQIIPNFLLMISDSDKIGRKCHEDKFTKPSQCLLKYIDTSKLLTEEKEKQLREEKKRKKKEKKEKKQKQKDEWLKSKGDMAKNLS